MYPQFREALLQLGNSNIKRGEALEVSYKTVERYLDDDLPEPILKLLRHPHLLRALADDAESLIQDDKFVVISS